MKRRRAAHGPRTFAVRLLRALRALTAPGHPARPTPPSRPDQLRALLAVLDDAVLAQTPADAAVAACGEPGPVARWTARRSGQQSIALYRLRARLEDLWLTDPELLAERDRAARLLAYDLWMLRESLNLAFAVRPTPRTEAARQRLNGLGRPAKVRLLQLGALVAVLLLWALIA
ncbi:hypothetical protein ABZ896_31670, partial [Streptomyces sp. NPDC047072]|uniref:hypothetical protein n=1 Tax=Streptomyces sp. NPDC047072 TaxID=3154809 RepID=UPI0033E0DE09